MLYTVNQFDTPSTRVTSQQRSQFHNSPNTMYNSPPDCNNIPSLLHQNTSAHHHLQAPGSVLPSPLVHKFSIQRQHSDAGYPMSAPQHNSCNNLLLSSPNTHPSSYRQPIATQLSLFGSPHTSAIPLPVRDDTVYYQQQQHLSQPQQFTFDELSLAQRQYSLLQQSLFHQQTHPHHQPVFNPHRYDTDVQQPNGHKPKFVPGLQRQHSVAPRPCKDRVVFKLTHALMNTYNSINEQYYQQRNADVNPVAATHNNTVTSTVTQQHVHTIIDPPIYNNGHDDKEYNYIATIGEVLHQRYTVESPLGKGSFGKVVRCFDTLTNEYVAVKIVKSKSAFYKQAQIEITILNDLQQYAQNPDSRVVRMLDTFVHHSHQCIVFELLSSNLYDLLKHTKFNGLPMDLVVPFAVQLLSTLQQLQIQRDPNKHILHCDLKPENILLKAEHGLAGSDQLTTLQLQSLRTNPSLVLIDFGSACYLSHKAFSYIQSRFYRAPEVLLGIQYNTAIDMFSLGCVLFELYTGRPLFDGCDESDQLVKHYSILGIPPPNMLLNNRKADKYYAYEQSNNSWRLRSRYINRHARRSLRDAFGSRWSNDVVHEQFEDLLLKMLTYDPRHRIKPVEALQHSFFTCFTGSVMQQPQSRMQTSLTLSATSSPLCYPGRSLADHTAMQTNYTAIAPVLATIKTRTQSYAIPLDTHDMYQMTDNTAYGRKRAYSASTTTQNSAASMTNGNGSTLLAIDVTSPGNVGNSPFINSTLFNQLHVQNVKSQQHIGNTFSPKWARSNTNERVAVIDLLNGNGDGDESKEYSPQTYTRHASFDHSQQMVISPPSDAIANSTASVNGTPYIQCVSANGTKFAAPKPMQNRSRRGSDADNSSSRSRLLQQSHAQQQQQPCNDKQVYSKLIHNQA